MKHRRDSARDEPPSPMYRNGREGEQNPTAVLVAALRVAGTALFVTALVCALIGLGVVPSIGARFSLHSDAWRYTFMSTGSSLLLFFLAAHLARDDQQPRPPDDPTNAARSR